MTISAADFLPRTQFGDIQFPSEVTHLRMQFRHHVHEYPHTPGGALEKLGRGLVRVTVAARFHNTFPAYPNLYPAGMQTLWGYATLGGTLPFVHPSAGSFPACIVDWDQVKAAKVRSGEDVEITFLEDQSSSFALAAVTTNIDSATQSLADIAAEMYQALIDVRAQLSLSQNDMSLLASLQAAVNAVTSVSDQAQLYGNLYEASLQRVLDLAAQVDSITGLQDQRAWPVIDGLRSLQYQTTIAIKNLQAQTVSLLTYNVPSTQPLIAIANSLYGDAGEAGSLLSLNGARITDPMAVLAGTAIRYYPPTPTQRAAS